MKTEKSSMENMLLAYWREFWVLSVAREKKRKTIFPCLSSKGFQRNSPRNIVWTGEWKESLEFYAENCSELRSFQEKSSHILPERRSREFSFRFTIENVDRRTHSARLIFVYVLLLYCSVSRINLSSLIYNEK